MSINVADVDDDLLDAYRSHWWQIWKPRLRQEDTEIRFGESG